MAHFNQFTVIANLGKAPEVEVKPDGKRLTKFSIAIWQGKNLEPWWLNITCWNELAEKAAKELDKGSRVFVQGRLQVKPFTDKNSVKRQAIELIATTVQALDKKADSTSTEESEEPV